MESQTLSDSPTHKASRFSLPNNPWFYALLSSCLLFLLLATRFISDPDLGFHLKGGQWIVQNHRFPSVDEFTYTVAGHPYLDIQWFYQVGLYLTYRIGNYPLLSILNIVLIATAFFITYKRVRLTATPYAMGILLFAVLVVACEKRFQVRPEIVSWVLLALTLWVLDQRLRSNRNLLYLLPFIQVLWVNVEGLFPLGWACMGAYVLRSFLTDRPDKKLLGYSSLAMAFCLLNPYFLKGVLFPLDYLVTLGTPNAFKQTIAEFQPSWTFGSDPNMLFLPWVPLFVYKAFSIALFILMAASWRKREVHEWLLVAAFFTLSATALRNIPLFMLVGVPVAAACWRDLPWARLQEIQRKFFDHPFVPWTFVFCVFLFGARVATNAYYCSDRRLDRIGLGLDNENFPVKATQFLWDKGLNGRLLNQLDEGGWLAWKGPQKEFADGRLEVMGEDFFNEYQNSFVGDGLPRLADKYQANIIFFNPHTATNWIYELKPSKDWRQVYLDGNFTIYLRSGYAPQVPALDNDGVLKEVGVEKIIASNSREVLAAHRPLGGQDWLAGLFVPQTFPHDLMNIGLFFFNNDQPLEAEPVFLEAIRRSRGEYFEFYMDLAILYAFNGRPDEAMTAAKQVLLERPDNPVAGKILANGGHP